MTSPSDPDLTTQPDDASLPGTRARLRRDRVALNAIQWINVKADPDDPESEDLWLFSDPDFRSDYPRVLAEIKDAGFEATMMEVLPTQTLQDYAGMIRDSGLRLAPGYCSIAIPSDHGRVLPRGSAERMHWFDGVRRKAEESNYVGLDSVFLAPEVAWRDNTPRTMRAVGVGADFAQERLDEQVEFLAEAAEVLKNEGVRAGLHSHVGTWIETEAEVVYTLDSIPADLLGASFDIGHLTWAGIDATALISRYADRVIDLHIKDLDLDVAKESRATPTTYRAATDRGLFREPGLGEMDIDGMLAALPQGFDGWLIIEVDRASMNPRESARRSWEWVKERLAVSTPAAP